MVTKQSTQMTRVRCRAINGTGKRCTKFAGPSAPTFLVAVSGFCGFHCNMAFTCGAIVQEIVDLLRDEGHEDLAKRVVDRYGLRQPDEEVTER